jgi:hypothetical protein
VAKIRKFYFGVDQFDVRSVWRIFRRGRLRLILWQEMVQMHAHANNYHLCLSPVFSAIEYCRLYTEDATDVVHCCFNLMYQASENYCSFCGCTFKECLSLNFHQNKCSHLFVSAGQSYWNLLCIQTIWPTGSLTTLMSCNQNVYAYKNKGNK